MCVSVAMHAKKITNGCVCVCLGVRGGEPSTDSNVHMLIVYTYRVIDPCIICDESQIDHPTERCQIWIQRYSCAQAVGLWMFLLQPLQRGRLWWDSVWGCFAQAGIQAVDPSMWQFPAGNEEDVAVSIQQIWHALFCTVGFHRRQARSCFRLACRGPESHVHRPSRNPLGLAAKGSPQPSFNFKGR